MEYEFEVEGDIKGKSRPRVNSYTGIVYTPNNTKEYENLIKQYFVMKYPRYETIQGRVHVKIVAFFKYPKNISKKKMDEMKNGDISPTKKPDIDNVIKIALDALNKIAFKDDNQITKIEVEKRFQSTKNNCYIFEI